MLKDKKWYLVLGVTGALVLLLGGVGIAYAQQPQPSSEGGPFLGRERFPGGGTFMGGGLGRVMPQAPMRGGPFRVDTGHGGPFGGLIRVTADITGLSEVEVITALEDGQTIAEIADSHDVNPQEIVDAAIAEAESRLQEAVDNGRLTEEQMDEMLAHLAEELPGRLEQSWEPGSRMGAIFEQFGEGFWTAYDGVAEVLGLEPEALFTELHGGRTIAEIAEERDVEMEEIRDALEAARIEARRQAIEQAVENGRLSQEQADWMIEGLEKGFTPAGRGIGRGRGRVPGNGSCGRGPGW